MSTTTATRAVRGLSHANEVFCQCLARGYKQSDAYKEAYPKSRLWTAASAANKASALAKVAAIQARVAAIREPVIRDIQANTAGYGLQQAMEEAQRAMALAESSGQAGAMVAAVQLRAKLNALLIDRKEVQVSQMGSMTPTDKQVLLDAATAALDRIKQVKLIDNTVDDVDAK
jgi:uncharacterized protein YoaH (UPF0181 family)